jgi:hypothetical protein
VPVETRPPIAPAPAVGGRQRMYLFERGYVEFKRRVHTFWGHWAEARTALWRWFISGKGNLAGDLLYVLAGTSIALFAFGSLLQSTDLEPRRRAIAIVAGIIALLVAARMLVKPRPSLVVSRIFCASVAAGPIVVVSLTGTALLAVLFLPYLLLLVLLTTASFLVFLPIRFVHTVWLLFYRIAHRCPHDDCGCSKLPIHVCSCGAHYADLAPNFYGVFHHTCHHTDGDVRLPTLDLLGRRRLLRLCGGCKRPVVHSSLGELSEVPILLVGAAAVGKTVFVLQAVRRLRERLGGKRGNSVRLDSAEQERRFDEELCELDLGQVPRKTSGDTVTALGIAIRLKTPRRFRGLLQIFDAPGEHFESEREFGRKQILKHLGGIVLIVDPFSLPSLAPREASGQEGSATPFDQVISSLLGALTTHGVLERGRKCSVPLAVVLGKVDALSDTTAGEFATFAGREPSDDISTRCQRMIEALGGGNSMRALEQSFEKKRFFAVSALGRTPDPRDTRPFEPLGVEAPLLWLAGLEESLASDASATPKLAPALTGANA